MKLSLREFGPTRANILIGITIVIGTIGGVYLLARGAKLFSKVTERKPKKKNTDRCNVCFAELDLDDYKSCATCCNCGKSVCRGRQCSVWLPSQAGWECQLCNLSNESRSRASEWVHRQTVDQYLRPMSAKERNRGSRLSVCETQSETPSSICPEQKEKVREYVEEILSNMLGGSLDEISVGQLYKSKNYLPISGSQNDYEGVSHVKLKRLIEKIIEDVLHLPAIIDHSGVPSRSEENLPPYFDPKKYQELLATAVLNKIIDAYNYEKKFNTTEKASTSDLDKNHNTVTPKTEQGYSSSSSVEPHSDSSLTDAINLNRCGLLSPSDSCDNLIQNNTDDDDVLLTDYLTNHKIPLPDFGVESESASEDFISIATSNGVESSWEDNWLFKRKKHGNDSPAPIGMLVPAPKEDVRALIGDKTTDEVSDLSEAGSDFEGEDCDMDDFDDTINSSNERVLNKHVIGGKSTVGLFDELLEQTSLISSSSLQDYEPLYCETKNDFVLGDDGLNDIETPNINLRTGSIPIENEAVNSMITVHILQDSPPKNILEATPTESFEESILEPPVEFTDDLNSTCEVITEEVQFESKTQVNNLSELLEFGSPLNESNGGGASLESNTTDESTSTVLDVCEVRQTDNLKIEQSVSDAQPLICESTNQIENNTDSAITNKINAAPNNTLISAPINESSSNMGENTISKPILGEDDLGRSLKHLIPGSIAEREHKKWYNAVEMPNNPYSPEALIRRLSDGPEKPMDIPNISPVLDKATNEDKVGNLENTEEKQLSIGLETENPDYKRYSRDYYINDSKHASGSRKNNLKPLDMLSPQSADSEIELNTPSPCLKVSQTDEDKRTDNFGDIFLAKPVRVEESDPILNKATKLEYLSTPERDFYLLPSEEAVNLKRSVTPSDQNSSQTTDSLTASEDSDTIRIYDLNKQETRIIKDETIKTPPSTPTRTRPTVLSFTPKAPVPTKVVTPTSLRFLQPKRKLFDPIMTDSIDKSFITMDADMVQAPLNGVSEKPVIEQEVASSLPSVKALAQAFLLASSKASSISLNKPKSSSWQSLDLKSEPITPTEEEYIEPKSCDGSSSDSYSPPYQQRYCPISPANMSVIPESDDNKIENNSPVLETGISSTAERPISPVVKPGQLRNSIAFFENLKNK